VIEVRIRLVDGFREVWEDGHLVAEVHPTDARQFTSGNWAHNVASWAREQVLPTHMAPRISGSASGSQS
jgi:hypothetical protein